MAPSRARLRLSLGPARAALEGGIRLSSRSSAGAVWPCSRNTSLFDAGRELGVDAPLAWWAVAAVIAQALLGGVVKLIDQRRWRSPTQLWRRFASD